MNNLLGSSSMLPIVLKKKKLQLIFGLLIMNIELKLKLIISFLNLLDFTLVLIGKVVLLIQQFVFPVMIKTV